MKSQFNLLIGAPITNHDEARFLHTLRSDLSSADALVLANFELGGEQIDFVVVTSSYAAILELKHFPRPIIGDLNGHWHYISAAGNLERHDGRNPYTQALSQKFALSDEMRDYQKTHSTVPAPNGRAYFAEFEAFVCICPKIHAESRVTPGDRKVRVASYESVLKAVLKGDGTRRWGMLDWERFALERLKLTRATVEEATDLRLMDARTMLSGYRARAHALLTAALPPLPKSGDSQEAVLALRGDRNLKVIGPSGSCKTFLLNHFMVGLLGDDQELPLLIEAKKFTGDFARLLHRSVAPSFSGDPKTLLDAARLCGVTPTLLIDAVNECPTSLVDDFLKSINAYLVRFGGRIVATTQDEYPFPGEMACVEVRRGLPNAAEKRAIYAYHAGVEASSELDVFCEGFDNAFDVVMAGHCASSGKPGSRRELFDRYVRRCLPNNTIVATALLRHVAVDMGESLTFALERHKFDEIAERFLVESKAPLGIADAVLSSRLVSGENNFFTFEHEQLMEFFRAEAYRREHKSVENRGDELRRPRNQKLIEPLVSLAESREEIVRLLELTNNCEVLSRIMRGDCGEFARGVLIETCRDLINRALADLPAMSIECNTVEVEDGRRRLDHLVARAAEEYGEHDVALCEVMGRNLHVSPLLDDVVELVAATEAALWVATELAARTYRFSLKGLWGEVVRYYGGVLRHGKVTIPAAAILSEYRQTSHSYTDERLASIGARFVASASHGEPREVSQLAALVSRGGSFVTGDVDAVKRELARVKDAWDSGIYILRLEAMHYVQMLAGKISEKVPDARQSVIDTLDSLESENLFENSARLEALSVFGGVETSVTPSAAVLEMRSIIAPDMECDEATLQLARISKMSPTQFLAARAYGCVSSIFEDIFQGAYFDAYNALEQGERLRLLTLASQREEIGFFGDWVLKELLSLNDASALPAFQRFASRADWDVSFPQQSVAVFVLGIAGCSRWMSEVPEFQSDGSSESRVWPLFGEILFWQNRSENSERVREIWEMLRQDDSLTLAAGDALYRIATARWQVDHVPDISFDLVDRAPDMAVAVALACLESDTRLPSLFNLVPDVARTAFLIDLVAKQGDISSIETLERLSDSSEFGAKAIDAISEIQRRKGGVGRS